MTKTFALSLVVAASLGLVACNDGATTETADNTVNDMEAVVEETAEDMDAATDEMANDMDAMADETMNDMDAMGDEAMNDMGNEM